MFVQVTAVFALLVVLVCAVARPFGKPEAVFAVPAAALVILCGAVPWEHVREEAERLGPVIGFLAAVLVLAKLCDDEGLFRACGGWMARWSRGRPRRLLGSVFVLASGITAVLSLDATVVLLTPVVFVTAARMGVDPKPHVYASAHLSNTASLLLPVSNLTNLLAFAASGLTFTRFAALMALPWTVAIAVEYAVFRWFFARSLRTGDRRDPDAELAKEADSAQAAPPIPVFAMVTVACTLAGFVVTSALGVEPAWAAAAGAGVLAVRALLDGRTTLGGIRRAAALPFLAFVLALGIVVRAVVDGGLGAGLARVLPDGASLPALLAIAGIAAVLANLINNLPAVLALLPLAAGAAATSGPGPLLAVLLGVNIGPNLTYAGSLATLLWRRIAHQHDHEIALREFTLLGLATVPAALAASTVALWASLGLFGMLGP
ncbi:SLC13 family permease (plasmid) [Streptomyces sp. BI20]|uniref:SLC13 family permease n=1 Tax=Streptomyces sp. BI20 TaxID=3403460 RepID=UPI003C75AE79